MEMRYLIAFVGLIYLAVGLDQLRKGSIPNAIIYTGYAFSNVGLFILTK
jgi:hypothetical protein